ncbi:hypothetical protein KR018_005088 [Drosophila ironensis]|nr:hypothetical protein KR018_005088 [Drosophila ironensis]
MPRRKALEDSNNMDEEARPTPTKRSRIVFRLEVPQRREAVGKVLVCGTGDTGQLGLGEDVMERKRLSEVQGIPEPVEVCSGGMHNLVLTKGGDIYSFGCNDEGALGRDTSEEGSEMQPGKIELPKRAVTMSAGDSHSACLMEDGSVYAWGSFRDSHGNMGLTLEGNKRTPIALLEGTVCSAISSGADHLVILTSTGKVYTVGCAEQGQLGRISERSVGGEGRRGKRDLLRPDQLIVKRTKPFDAIWATNYCTFMRESQSETTWAVGLNNYKQLTHPKDDERILQPVRTAFRNVRQISGGAHHTILLNNDQQCLVIGRHNYGRLGLGELNEDVVELTPVSKLANKVVSVGGGESCSYAIDEDGKLFSWGIGNCNQLGVGDGEDEWEPVLVSSKNTQNSRALMATGGGQHAIFLFQDEAAEKKEKENVPQTPVEEPKTEEEKKDEPQTTKGGKGKKAAATKGKKAAAAAAEADESHEGEEAEATAAPEAKKDEEKAEEAVAAKGSKTKKPAAKKGKKKE